MVGITVLMILLTASAQSWTAIMKREREAELIFRGNQYMQALRLYAVDHGGSYPIELKTLLERGPRGYRYIRQLYADPFDEEGEWNLIYLAPNGRGAWNPHARLPQNVVEAAGGVAGAAAAGLAGGGLSGGSAGSGLPASHPNRKSGFSSGNINTPIVGVVSKGTDRAFQVYYGKHHYDEWEFHVFVGQLPHVQGRPAGAVNINAGGQLGPGGGLSPQGNTKDDGTRGVPAPKGLRGRGN